MSMCSRKTASVLLGVACVAALIYSQALAGKPSKPPSDGGGTPPGTIFYWDDGVQAVIGMDGDGNNAYVASPYEGYPSYGTYGEDDHRWFLTTVEIPGETYPDGSPHLELFALRPDPSLEDGAEWVQLTDLDGRTEEDPLNVVQIGFVFTRYNPQKILWARDDTFVAFMGIDHRDGTECIFRVPISASDVDLDRGNTIPCELDDLETVLSMPPVLGDFTWSPDGTKIAYARNFVVYVHTLGNTEPDLCLWENPNSFKDLDWSPDGEKIALRRDYHLVILDPDVENQDPVVLDVAPSPRSLAWSPDSQWFAVSTLSWKGVLKPPYDNVKYDIGRTPATGQGLTYVESFTSSLDKGVVRLVLRWTP